MVGNVNLRPEYGLTWDAGLRYADGTTTLEGAFFDHRYEDLIQFVHTSQATSRPVNIGKARVYGFEMTAQRRFGSRAYLSGNYTYQKATDKSEIFPIWLAIFCPIARHTRCLFARQCVWDAVLRFTIMHLKMAIFWIKQIDARYYRDMFTMRV